MLHVVCGLQFTGHARLSQRAQLFGLHFIKNQGNVAMMFAAGGGEAMRELGGGGGEGRVPLPPSTPATSDTERHGTHWVASPP